MFITSVSVPSVVLGGQSFSIDVKVTATDDDFEDGSAYRLSVFVTSLAQGGLLVPPIVLTGHLQDSPWTAVEHTFQLPVTAGSPFDIYTVNAALIEGPKGTDPDDSPSFASAGPILVVF